MTSGTLAKIRKIHRNLVGLAAVFLTVSAVTGILWAFAPFLYWEEGYMEPKTLTPAPDLMDARISIAELTPLVNERFGDDAKPIEITLKSSAGMLVYQVRTLKAGGSSRGALLDAVSGKWISPLDRDTAIRLARPFVRGNPPVEEALFLEHWTPRKQTQGRTAWKICFLDPGRTEILLDPDTGEILEEQDLIRKFHFVVMDLHQLNFFGFRKTLTLLPGALMIGMVATGLALWHQARWRPVARKKAVTPAPQTLE